MKKIKFIFLISLLFLSNCTIKKQLQEQDSEILVASHRGDWRNYADNALEGIESCIRMGVDIVEIDVSQTKDGHLILMHDKKVDRTTNGKGLVSELTLEEIKGLYLRNGLGRVSEFKVPTLEEAMLTAKGRITVNLDKADKYFDDVYKILQKTGTVEQTIIKSDKPYQELRTTFGEHFDKMIFMPIIMINEETTINSISEVLDKKYPCYEIVFEHVNKELLLQIKGKLQNTSSQIWINSLWPSLSGGYSDDKALNDPDAVYGYLIDTLGASIIQTDRPQYLIDYLRKRGLHK